MSNPNTSTLSIYSRRSSENGMRVVHIGKKSQPVNLAKMSSVNNHSLNKSACFEALKRNVFSLSGSHTVADLVPLISSEILQDTGSAFQEVQSTALQIIDFASLLGNLEPVIFLTSTGKEAKIEDPGDLKKRDEDITFIKFNCFLDGSQLDSRVTTIGPLSFQFFLRLPQYSFDAASGATISATVSKPPPSTNKVATSLSSRFGATSASPSTLFTPHNDDDRINHTIFL